MRSYALQRLLYYMRERELIRRAKEAGLPRPWTTDPILRMYKFTNVHRRDDYTSKRMFQLYDMRRGESSTDIVLYNCALYRYFGTVGYATQVGWLLEHDQERIISTARDMMRRKEQVFTGAYIVTNAGLKGPKEEAVAGFMKSFWDARLQLTEIFALTPSWRTMYYAMHLIKGFGGKGFMAKEILQDFLYNYPRVAVDEFAWTPIGPGARRGINRVLFTPISEETVTEKFLAPLLKIREWLLPHWVTVFPSDTLSAHDVQFVLCEFDKYERTRLGEGHPRSFYRPRSTP